MWEPILGRACSQLDQLYKSAYITGVGLDPGVRGRHAPPCPPGSIINKTLPINRPIHRINYHAICCPVYASDNSPGDKTGRGDQFPPRYNDYGKYTVLGSDLWGRLVPSTGDTFLAACALCDEML